ncbi:AlpA family phage regulatory protein [Acinetobacter defluvii]|uniref:AlpA family phage regulatory protein n=1 Tax=Acinetobacter defluvii TaxID=1871111 RepID=A0A2S2FHJ2_9GAMM|nr:AlpA family phage regulatory protein [Acinetobacter defluvii]AWL30414.1 AlpA family phage regulatory protein [Acinetobacter defluvii]
MTISKTKQSTNSPLICQKQVQQRTGLNTSEIKILMAHNLFPKSIKISKRLLWIEEEIHQWISMLTFPLVDLNFDLSSRLNLLCRQFNQASDCASLASRNLIYYGKVVKPRLRKQIEDIKDQLQPKLI